MSSEVLSRDRLAWRPAVNRSSLRTTKMDPSHLPPAKILPLSTDTDSSPAGEQTRRPSSAGHVRWVICALLLFGTTKNYMDRQVLGLLKSTLQHDFGWNEIQYGNLVFAFQAAYAVGLLVVGRIIDRVGTRIGYACAMVFWSLASMGHAVGSSLASFTVARAALGFGEAGVFPAS